MRRSSTTSGAWKKLTETRSPASREALIKNPWVWSIRYAGMRFSRKGSGNENSGTPKLAVTALTTTTAMAPSRWPTSTLSLDVQAGVPVAGSPSMKKILPATEAALLSGVQLSGTQGVANTTSAAVGVAGATGIPDTRNSCRSGIPP
jgi:hypothetical protein